MVHKTNVSARAKHLARYKGSKVIATSKIVGGRRVTTTSSGRTTTSTLSGQDRAKFGGGSSSGSAGSRTSTITQQKLKYYVNPSTGQTTFRTVGQSSAGLVEVTKADYENPTQSASVKNATRQWQAIEGQRLADRQQQQAVATSGGSSLVPSSVRDREVVTGTQTISTQSREGQPAPTTLQSQQDSSSKKFGGGGSFDKSAGKTGSFDTGRYTTEELNFQVKEAKEAHERVELQKKSTRSSARADVKLGGILPGGVNRNDVKLAKTYDPTTGGLKAWEGKTTEQIFTFDTDKVSQKNLQVLGLKVKAERGTVKLQTARRQHEFDISLDSKKSQVEAQRQKEADVIFASDKFKSEVESGVATQRAKVEADINAKQVELQNRVNVRDITYDEALKLSDTFYNKKQDELNLAYQQSGVTAFKPYQDKLTARSQADLGTFATIKSQQLSDRPVDADILQRATEFNVKIKDVDRSSRRGLKEKVGFELQDIGQAFGRVQDTIATPTTKKLPNPFKTKTFKRIQMFAGGDDKTVFNKISRNQFASFSIASGAIEQVREKPLETALFFGLGYAGGAVSSKIGAKSLQLAGKSAVASAKGLGGRALLYSAGAKAITVGQVGVSVGATGLYGAQVRTKVKAEDDFFAKGEIVGSEGVKALALLGGQATFQSIKTTRQTREFDRVATKLVAESAKKAKATSRTKIILDKDVKINFDTNIKAGGNQYADGRIRLNVPTYDQPKTTFKIPSLGKRGQVSIPRSPFRSFNRATGINGGSSPIVDIITSKSVVASQGGSKSIFLIPSIGLGAPKSIGVGNIIGKVGVNSGVSARTATKNFFKARQLAKVTTSTAPSQLTQAGTGGISNVFNFAITTPLSEPATVSIPRTRPTPDFGNTVPKNPIPFVFFNPKGASFGFDRRKRKGKKLKRKTFYTPNVEAIVRGIKRKKGTKTKAFYTGFEFRGIL